MAKWQVQQAKAKFSAVLDKAQSEGPQTITRHGVDTAVVLSIEEYRKLAGNKDPDLKTLLLQKGPYWPEGFELPERQIDPPREVDFGD